MSPGNARVCTKSDRRSPERDPRPVREKDTLPGRLLTVNQASQRWPGRWSPRRPPDGCRNHARATAPARGSGGHRCGRHHQAGQAGCTHPGGSHALLTTSAPASGRGHPTPPGIRRQRRATLAGAAGIGSGGRPRGSDGAPRSTASGGRRLATRWPPIRPASAKPRASRARPQGAPMIRSASPQVATTRSRPSHRANGAIGGRQDGG